MFNFATSRSTYNYFLYEIFHIISYINLNFNIFNQSFAQSSLKDSIINISVIGVNYTRHIPGGDLADRFGGSNIIGLSYTFKFTNNLMIGISGGYIFSMTVKEDNILDEIKSSKGYLINGQGMMEPIILEERGYLIMLSLGKVFPVFGPNQNSGLFVKFGGGFIEHKILIDYDVGPLYQLEGDYIKGYDRLTNGFAISENFGYIYFDNNNFINLSLSLDFVQAFTRNRRDWNFDTMEKDDRNRLDLLYGLKFSINIPIYRRAPEDFYF